MEFKIETKWDGSGVDHEPVSILLEDKEEGMNVIIEAPYFGDPENPGGERGKPFDKLWDYEVVEVFFLNGDNEEYLEVEFCPHGQHQILVLKGCRKPWKTSLELDNFVAEIHGKSWTGKACLPWGYFPQNVDKMNAYAIHGSGKNRSYESLYPVPESDRTKYDQPDFHRLQYFHSFKLQEHSISKRRDAKIWDQLMM